MRKPRLPEEKHTNIENLKRKKIQSLLSNITQTSQTAKSVSKEKVNTLCSEFSEIFNDSADSCNDYKNGSNTATKKTRFGYQCARSHKASHCAKKIHANHPSFALKASVVSASKLYKKKLNYFIRKHKKDTQNELRKLKSKSSK